MTITRTNYPPLKASEAPLRVYAGTWNFNIEIPNPDGEYYTVRIRAFLDNVLIHDDSINTDCGWRCITVLIHDEVSVSLSEPGDHRFLIETWAVGETQPRDEYSFQITVMKPEVSSLQASSKAVRGLGDNSLKVTFTNGGNEDMRQATLSPSDAVGLNITPDEVELGDVNVGETASAEFTVSAPADVTLGTAQPKFKLSFLDYVGIPHTETVNADVEVYRLEPTLSISTPETVENGKTTDITAQLREPNGQPIPGEIMTFVAGDKKVGTAETAPNGNATISYTPSETGTIKIEASFGGSASYGPASTSSTMKVTSPSSPLPTTPLAVLAILSIIGVIAYLTWRRKKGTKEANPTTQ